MTYGVLGGHYVGKGMVNPLTTSEKSLMSAFHNSHTVFTSALDWALKRDAIVVPRVRSWWQARLNFHVLSMQGKLPNTSGVESMDDIIEDPYSQDRPFNDPQQDKFVNILLLNTFEHLCESCVALGVRVIL